MPIFVTQKTQFISHVKFAKYVLTSLLLFCLLSVTKYNYLIVARNGSQI